MTITCPLPQRFYFAVSQVEALVRHILTYGLLAGLLAGFFVGCIVGLLWLLHPLVGQTSEPSIVAATLLVAVLFQLLRRRIYTAVDHRFYPERYTTAQTAEEFQQAMQNEVDLSQLSERIITRVHETIHPAFASLWIFSLCFTASKILLYRLQTASRFMYLAQIS